MDVGSPKTPTSDFGFAFNDANFSDRVLRIEIVADPPESRAAPDESLVDWSQNRKRRRDDEQSENFNDTAEECEERILSCTALDLEDGVNHENQENSAIAMILESHEDIEISTDQASPGAAQENETSSSMDCSVVQVKTIHISSPILAAKSPFFYKLFSDGVEESEQRQSTIRIHASEEEALMDLLNFIYSNTLLTTAPTALLNVLMAADKFEVASCMRYCSQLLRNSPMSCESALLYLDLPSTISMAESVKPLMNAAKKFLAARFKEFSKFQEELLKLPLTGIEAVLSSDELQVASEDSVYDFVIKWSRKHYPKLEERREILSTHLLRYIRFPYLTCRKLKKFLTCKDIEHDVASKLVINALFFKSTAPYRKRSLLVAEESNSHFSRFVERAYKYRPIKVVAFDSPRQQCIAYLDLKRDECLQLYPSGRVYSQAFELAGQGFFLSGHCNVDQQGPIHCFGLFLGMQEKGGSTGFTVEYELASRVKPSKDFVIKYKGNYKFAGGKAVGYRNFFVVPWSVFVDDNSPYFIDGVLHLRAELTIKE